MKRLNFFFLSVLILLTAIKSPAQDPDPEWAKRNGWFFDNFTKDSLTWNMFRETFIGVAPSPGALDFDQVFYDNLYKTKLSSPGLCYGLDVMELLMLKNGGHLGYCHPPYVYPGGARPDDPNLETAIEITHGNQINHGFLSFMLDVIAVNKLRDGNYCFAKVQEFLSQGDYPVICISSSEGILSQDGHCIVPYAVTQSGSTKKIWVYDPNRSWYIDAPDGRQWYDAHNNFITVNATTGAWSFTMVPSFGTWSGDPGNGGRIVACPISVAGKKDRLPQSLLAEGAYALNSILIFGNIKLEQITEPCSGRHLLNETGTALETAEDKRMNNMISLVPLNGGYHSKGSEKNNGYFFRGSDPVTIRFRPFGEFKVGMMFRGKYYEIKGTGKGEVQEFSPEEKYLTPIMQLHPR